MFIVIYIYTLFIFISATNVEHAREQCLQVSQNVYCHMYLYYDNSIHSNKCLFCYIHVEEQSLHECLHVSRNVYIYIYLHFVYLCISNKCLTC